MVGPPFNYNSMSSPELAQQVATFPKYAHPQALPPPPSTQTADASTAARNHLTRNPPVTDRALTLNFFIRVFIDERS